ncbi:Uncharacterized protein M6B38_232630 [Iris pallida]|uniref:Uncharacterized protein n=1 Tax=Iris pallida TaxID=29817 RepID=A0AAX6DRM5_IRIPA|nr:Uncharacterized protein M6B38_232630 [Iris pallida]
MFLSVGITLGKLLQYKEVHQEGEESHWYQELVRVTLGPGKRGQWTWNNQPSSPNLTRFGPLFEDLRGPPKYMLSQFVGGSITRDQIIASDDENEDTEAPFIQKLFGIMRIYYTFLEIGKRTSLGILAGVYSSNDQPSRLPTLVVLSVTAFQLFFIMLKKPFIKKRVQLVEIISVASELLVFVSSLVLLEGGFSESGERRVGFLMLAAFVVGLSAQLINEWYSLYLQVVRMSPGEAEFFPGLKTAATGILLLLLPSGLVKDLDRGNRDQGAGSETRDKPWMRQLRELAKESFSKEAGDTTPPPQVKDPSTSRSAFWGAGGSEPSSSRSGGLWGGKRSGGSSVTSSTDFKAKSDVKAKSRGLYKDLEAIFSSK